MKSYVTFILIIVINSLYAQNVSEAEASIRGAKSDVLLYEQWYRGNIYLLNGDVLPDKAIRYNLKSNAVQLISEDQSDYGTSVSYRSIGYVHIKRFEIYNKVAKKVERFINASDFTVEGTRLNGIMKELKSGNYALYLKTDIKLTQRAYVQALDMGDKNDKYARKTVYYVAQGNNLKELHSNKKRFAASFPDHEAEILAYIETHRISLKKEDDLIDLIQFLNTLGN